LFKQLQFPAFPETGKMPLENCMLDRILPGAHKESVIFSIPVIRFTPVTPIFAPRRKDAKLQIFLGALGGFARE